VPVGEAKGRKGGGEVTKKVTNNLVMVAVNAPSDRDCPETGVLNTKLVKRYRSNVNDLKWARRGVIATVKNGEVIPVIDYGLASAPVCRRVIIHTLDV
jgi:hypothetical protein